MGKEGQIAIQRAEAEQGVVFLIPSDSTACASPGLVATDINTVVAVRRQLGCRCSHSHAVFVLFMNTPSLSHGGITRH